MAKKCPDCGYMNDNEVAFCAECGEPLDPQVRLIMELEGKKAPTSTNSTKAARKTDDDDDDYIPRVSHDDEEEKKSPLGWIIGLIAVAAVVYFLFLR